MDISFAELNLFIILRLILANEQPHEYSWEHLRAPIYRPRRPEWPRRHYDDTGGFPAERMRRPFLSHRSQFDESPNSGSGDKSSSSHEFAHRARPSAHAPRFQEYSAEVAWVRSPSPATGFGFRAPGSKFLRNVPLHRAYIGRLPQKSNSNAFRRKRLSTNEASLGVGQTNRLENKPQRKNPIQASLENCLKETHPCTKIVGLSQLCQIHCAVKAIPRGHPLGTLISRITKVLNLVIQGICDPVKTTLDLGWKYFVENSKPVASFVKWQKKMGINVKQKVYSNITELADKLLSQIIKYAQTPLSVFASIFSENTTLVAKGRKYTERFNPGCYAMKLQAYANTFVDIFARNPTSIDVLLAGSAFVVNAGKYIAGPHQKVLQTVALANELLVNTSCGILYWVGIRGAVCDQISKAKVQKPRNFNKRKGTVADICPTVEREIKIFID